MKKYRDNFNKMEKIKLLIIILLLSIFPFNYLRSQIVINEILTSNFRTLVDEDYDEPDWIELYNNSSQAINIGGYRISDKEDFSKAWILPDTIIQPNGFYLLYSDDKNRKSSDKYIIEASGKGIKPDVKIDGFSFHYLIFEGDFEISVRLNSLLGMDLFGKVGLIIREELTDISRYAGIFAKHPDWNLYSFLYRTESNNYPLYRKHFGSQDYPYNWLKLKRQDDSIFVYVKYDGYHWTQIQSAYSIFPNKVFAGIACSASDPNNKTLAKFSFSELQVNRNPFSFDKFRIIEFNTGIKGSSGYSKESHTDFKLSADGEKLFLWDRSGQLVDTISFGKQRTNVSYGRFPDGSSNFVYSVKLTPSLSNLNGYKEIAERANIKPKSCYSDSIFNAIFLNSSDSSKIYYTINTMVPDTTSLLNTNDTLKINKTTILRANLFKKNQLCNTTESRTYFINERFDLPVISIIADSFDLWNTETGLFNERNLYSDREVFAHIDFFDKNGIASFSTEGGMRLHGQATRVEIPQKSLRFYSRNLYEDESFEYPFWGVKGPKETDKFILRNSGQDWYSALIRDAYCSVLGKKLYNCISFSYRPVVTYINGIYWGLYNLRERFDEDFISQKYDISAKSVNYIEDDIIKNGSSDSFYRAVDSLLKIDLNDVNAYSYAENTIAIDNLMDYLIMRIFTASYDWPKQNNKFWSSTQLDNKWRWVLHDFDLSLGINNAFPEMNIFEHICKNNCILSNLIQKLFNCDTFKVKFINLFADYLNTVFQPETTIPLLDSLANNIRSEIQFHNSKWNNSAIMWEMQIDTIRQFLLNRSDNVYKHIRYFFNLPGETVIILTSTIDDGCSFEINSLKINKSRWTGKYFQDIPIRIQCKPKEGYKFVRWENISTYKSATCLNSKQDTIRLIAVLVQSDIISDTGIVINEIMYNSSEENNCGDWFELYNSSSRPVDMTNWRFETKANNHFKIQESIIMMPRDYLIFCNSDSLFLKIYKANGLLIKYDSLKLSQDDNIMFFDDKNVLKDQVDYSNTLPWDHNADGTGNSLELINPFYDNNLAKYWKASETTDGSPWQENFSFVNIIKDEYLFTYSPIFYPNPAKDKIYIEIDFKNSSNICIKIYNLLGEEVIKNTNNNFIIDNHYFIETDISSLQEGIYILKILTGEVDSLIKNILFVVE